MLVITYKKNNIVENKQQTTSDKWKEYQDWLNEVPEISDEQITKLANEHILYNDSKRQWVIEGMKLYREQLKTK